MIPQTEVRKASVTTSPSCQSWRPSLISSIKWIVGNMYSTSWCPFYIYILCSEQSAGVGRTHTDPRIFISFSVFPTSYWHQHPWIRQVFVSKYISTSLPWIRKVSRQWMFQYSVNNAQEPARNQNKMLALHAAAKPQIDIISMFVKRWQVVSQATTQPGEFKLCCYNAVKHRVKTLTGGPDKVRTPGVFASWSYPHRHPPMLVWGQTGPLSDSLPPPEAQRGITRWHETKLTTVELHILLAIMYHVFSKLRTSIADGA